MKKTIFILCVCLLLSGCLSKEQFEKINLFWSQQILNVLLERASKNPEQLREFLNSPLYTKVMAGKAMPISTKSPVQAVSDEAQPQDGTGLRRPVPQVLDVTMDEKAFPGKAPYLERVLMKQDWDAVQENNQKTLQDLQTAFGNRVKEKAFYVMLQTEQQLKEAATAAETYKDYAAKQKTLLAAQETALKTLMTKNKSSIRRIKK